MEDKSVAKALQLASGKKACQRCGKQGTDLSRMRMTDDSSVSVFTKSRTSNSRELSEADEQSGEAPLN